MRAAAEFVDRLTGETIKDRVHEVRVEIFGSLAATGAGHGTFTAVLLGLEGVRPDAVTPAEVTAKLAVIEETGVVALGGRHRVHCRVEDFVLRPLTVRARHNNALSFTAFDSTGAELATDTYYSIGGGFVVRDGDEENAGPPAARRPFPFRTAAELLAVCEQTGFSIAEVMMANERVLRSETDIRHLLRGLWDVMESCVRSSIARDGVLPGGLGVRRRAGEWAARLAAEDPDHANRYWQQRVNLVALAVNEENASGGRIVTAPTNGAAGIIPAVLYYALHYTPASRSMATSEDDIVQRFLLTAGAIGTLYKANASISGAEVGCQGEVGSASSMAAAGLAEILGGTPQQVENAAEIAMEHNLGLTCDPIGGLVQIPCIERNAIAAAKAINAANMALWGDGEHHVSLDQVIATMRETGADMSDKYKETARGGLAVNVVEC